MISSLPDIEQRIEEKDNKHHGVKDYDFDNCYPQNIIDIVASSGTGTSCSKLYSEFIFGGGFKDQVFYRAKINSEGLTIDELLKKVCDKYSLLNGFAIHINYNALLQISDVSFVPFEYCRLGINENKGKVAIYDDWGCKYRNKIEKEKITYIDLFDPNPEAITQQIGEDITTYKGQVFWKSANGMDYPLAPCDSVLEDVVSDSSIKRFRLRNIRKGFNASTVVEYGYQFESEEERATEVDNWGKFVGPDSADIIVLENANGNSDSASIKISKLNTTDNDKMYQVTNQTVKDSIIQNYRQPKRLLAMSEDSNGFNSVNVQDDFKFYNSITSKERIIIEQDFQKIFSLFHINICPSNDYSVLPLEFDPVSTAQPALISTLGIGGTQALVGILQSTLSAEQKVNTIKIIFGLTTEQAQGMVIGSQISQ